MVKGRVRQSKMMITVRLCILCIPTVSIVYIQLSKKGDAWLRGQNAAVKGTQYVPRRGVA
jgi:hypothetical protein